MEAILHKEIILNKTICRLFCLMTFVLLTALGAFVRIPLPFTPVPITLQTFFVLLSGALLGSNLATLSQLSYMAIGLAGAPVFTQAGSGLSYLLGPTGGYLFGFLLVSFWLGRFIKYGRGNLILIFAIVYAADFLLLLCGVIWLKFILGYSFRQAFFLGLVPFIPGDCLKATAAAIIYLRISERIKQVL